jgi:hypothetical protein
MTPCRRFGARHLFNKARTFRALDIVQDCNLVKTEILERFGDLLTEEDKHEVNAVCD